MPPGPWQPSTAAAGLRARAQLLRDVRGFFAARNVLEVETPLLADAGNTDPGIESERTADGAYLRTSPEFALKRLLAAGSGDIFELGRVFRKAESGRHHNPEFTLLEWYRSGYSYHQLMDEAAELVLHCGRGQFDRWPQRRLSYRELFQRELGIDPLSAPADALAAAAAEHGIGDIELGRRQWLDLLLSHVIQPSLPAESLTFVYDYPADQAALAKIRPGNPPLAERFELYLGRQELANGYQELTDPDEQERRFAAENAERQRRDMPVCEIDRRLLAALRHGLPECAGVALGVDRLLMAISGAESIAEVIAFPVSRA